VLCRLFVYVVLGAHHVDGAHSHPEGHAQEHHAGGVAKLVGKVEVAVGKALHNENLVAKGIAKQEGLDSTETHDHHDHPAPGVGTRDLASTAHGPTSGPDTLAGAGTARFL
jgi:hypothetical protein